MYGLFVENGPLQVINKDLDVVIRNHTWNREFAVLYIDQPVGTGFSFTDFDEGNWPLIKTFLTFFPLFF